MPTYRNKIGVNVHSTYAAYKGVGISVCKAKIDNLGITWLRDNNPLGATVWGASYNVIWCNDANVKSVAVARAIQAVNAGCKAVELTNEPPIGNEAISLDLEINLAIIDAVRNIDPTLPIWNSALAAPGMTKANQLGCPAGVTHGGIHPYRGNTSAATWAGTLQKWYQTLTVMGPGKPYNVTETGFHDYTGTDNGGHIYTPESIAAVQVISNTEQMWNDGADKIFYYELLDEVNYRANNDHEGHFGMYYPDLTIKPHGTALKNYLATNGDSTWSSSGPVTPLPTEEPDPGFGSLIVGGVSSRAVQDMSYKVNGSIYPVTQVFYKGLDGVQRLVWTGGGGPVIPDPDLTVTNLGSGVYEISGAGAHDNGDGTVTLAGSGVTDNHNGTITLVGS